MMTAILTGAALLASGKPAPAKPAATPLPPTGAAQELPLGSGEPPAAGGNFAAPTDSKALAESLTAKLPEVETCYNEFRKRFPKQGGTFNYRFTINPDGRVAKVEPVSGPFQDEAFQKCLKTTMEKWQLAPQGGSFPTTVTLPFTFTPP